MIASKATKSATACIAPRHLSESGETFHRHVFSRPCGRKATKKIVRFCTDNETARTRYSDHLPHGFARVFQVDEESLAGCRVEGLVWKRQSAGVGLQGANTCAWLSRESPAKSCKVVRISIDSH